MLTGQLDGGFVRFCPGIAEEDAVGAAVADQPTGQLFLLGDSIEIGDVLKAAKLPFKAAAHGPVAVPQGVGGDASDSIEVATTAIVPDPATPPAHQREREAVVSVHHRIGMGAGGLEPPRPVAG